MSTRILLLITRACCFVEQAINLEMHICHNHHAPCKQSQMWSLTNHYAEFASKNDYLTEQHLC